MSAPVSRRTTARRLARQAITTESRIWINLGRWVLRRRGYAPDARPFGYAQSMTPLLLVFIVLFAIEVPVLDLVLPWPVVRIIADILGLYGVIWMLGLLAGLRIYPHSMSATGLRVRRLAEVDLTIDWDHIASVEVRSRPVAEKGIQVEHSGGATYLCLGVMKQTHIDITFAAPTTLELPTGETEPLRGLRIAADDPVALANLARTHLAPQSPPPTSARMPPSQRRG
jgi:hypothetical protein